MNTITLQQLSERISAGNNNFLLDATDNLGLPVAELFEKTHAQQLLIHEAKVLADENREGNFVVYGKGHLSDEVEGEVQVYIDNREPALQVQVRITLNTLSFGWLAQTGLLADYHLPFDTTGWTGPDAVFIYDSEQRTFSVELEGSTGGFTLFGSMQLEKAGLRLIRSCSEKVSLLELYGDHTFLGHPYRFALEIPVQNSTRWQLSLVSSPEESVPLNTSIEGLKQLPLFPAGFGDVPALLSDYLSTVVIDSLELEFRQLNSPQGRFSCSLFFPGAIELFNGCTLTLPALRIETGNLLGKPRHELEVSGSVNFGTDLRMGFSAMISNNDPWEFHTDADFSLKKLPSLLQPFGLDLASLHLPENLLQLHSLAVSRFDFTFDPAQKKLTALEADFHADAWVELIRGIKLGQPELSMQYESGEEGYAVNGSFRAELMVGRTSFFGTAIKNGTEWTLNAATGLLDPFPLNQLIEDVTIIAGMPVSIGALENVKVGPCSFTYETSGALEFKCTTEITFPLPFEGWETNRVHAYVGLNGKKKEDNTWTFTGHLAAAVEMHGIEIAVSADNETEGKRTLRGGWKADSEEATITTEKLLAIFGVSIDLSDVPDVLKPALAEFAFEYNEFTQTISTAAFTTNGTVLYFVAKKINDKWLPVIGIDYDTAKPSGDLPAEYSEALQKLDISQLHLLYAAVDLENFQLPQTPEVPGRKATTKLRIAGKKIDVKKGIFFAAEITNLQLPEIGKLHVNVEQFYLAVSKTDSVKAEVKGRVALTAGEAGAVILVNARYESKEKALRFEGAVETTMGFAAFADALLPEAFQLPEGLTLPDIKKATLIIDTGNKEFRFALALLEQHNKLEIPGISAMQLTDLSVSYSEQKFRFHLGNGKLQVFAFDLIFPEGVGGTLDLEVSKTEGKFSFQPDGFEISTPPITYQETTETAGAHGGTLTTITRNLCVAVTPGAFTVSRTQGKWEMHAGAHFVFKDFPDPVRRLFPQNAITGTLIVSGATASIEVSGTLALLTIPDLVRMTTDQLTPIGEMAVSLRKLRLDIGKVIEFTAEVGIALPARLNEFLGFRKDAVFRTYKPGDDNSFFGVQLIIGSKKISGGMTGSPFVDLDFVTHIDDRHIQLDFDKLFGREDLGAMVFTKPELALNFESGSFRFSGGYALDKKRGLRLPTYPVKRLLEAVKLGELAQHIPSSVPVKTMQADEVLKSTTDTLRQFETLPKALLDVLDTLQSVLDKLPARFNEYLSIRVPESLDFDIDISADGGVCFSVSAGNEGLQLLYPTPVALVGLRLRKLAFGTAFGGSLLRVDISADVDVFDYVMLAGALALPKAVADRAGLPVRAAHRTVKIDDLLILVVYQAGVPIPIPLFYTTFEVDSLGLEGIGLHTAIAFPKPQLNVMQLLKLVSDAKKFIVDGKDFDVRYPITFEEPAEEPPGLNLVFSAGPLYLQLPAYIAAADGDHPRRIGLLKKYRLFDALNTAGVLLNGIKHLVQDHTPVYLMKATPLEFRSGRFAAELFDALKLEFAWLFCTPKELSGLAQSNPSLFMNAGEAMQLLAQVRPAKDVRTAQEGELPVVSVPNDDNTVILFVKGAAKFSGIFDFKASGGLVLADGGAATSLALHANIANKLQLDLDGIIVLRNDTFRLAGKASFLLSGVTLFDGSYAFGHDHFSVSAKVLPTGSPVGFSGSLIGAFRNDHILLDGEAEARLLFFKANAVVSLHVIDGPSHFRIKGSVSESSLLRMRFEFNSELSHEQVLSHVLLHVEALGLLGIHFEGEAQVLPNGLQLFTSGEVRVSGRTAATAVLSLTPEQLTFETYVELFPGLRVTGKATVNDNSFRFDATGELSLGSFTPTAKVQLSATHNGQQFRLELSDFPWSGQQQVFTIAADNSETGTYDLMYTGTELSGFNGLFRISSGLGDGRGPNGMIRLTTAGVQELSFNGGITLFGITDTGSFHYRGGQFDILLRKVWNAGIFEGESEFTGTMKPGHLNCSASLRFRMSLGHMLADLLESWLHYRPDLSVLDSEFVLENFTINIDRKEEPGDVINEELRRREQQAREEMREAEARKRNAELSIEQQLSALNNTMASLEQLRPSLADPSRIDDLLNQLNKSYQDLDALHQTLNLMNSGKNGLENALAEKRNMHDAIVDRISRLSQLSLTIYDAASNWYWHNYSTRDYGPYRDAIVELYGFCEVFIAPYYPDARKDAEELQHYHYWTHFDRARFNHNRDMAGRALNRLQEVQGVLKQRAANSCEMTSQELDQMKRDLNELLSRIPPAVKDSAGLVLLAYAESRLIWTGKLVNEEIVFTRSPKQLGSGPYMATAENYNLIISARASFSLGGTVFHAPNLYWNIPLNNVHTDVAITDQLPELITDYLREHLPAILMNGLHSLPAIINFLLELTKRPMRAADQPDIDAIRLLHGLSQMSPDVAPAAANAAGIVTGTL